MTAALGWSAVSDDGDRFLVGAAVIEGLATELAGLATAYRARHSHVEPKIYVAGDAAGTAGNVVANAGLVRLSVVADLLDQALFIFLALTLYLLLKHVHHSVPLGYLTLKSGWFPKALSIILMVAGGCYLVDLLAAFLVPEFGQLIHGFIAIPCIIAEVWMLGYLLFIGVRTAKTVQPDERILTVA